MRFIAEFIVLVVLLLILLGVYLAYVAHKRPKPKVEKDIRVTPGLWYTYSREKDGFTEVGIQYVVDKNGSILERRCMQRIDTDADSSEYAKLLDKAQDEAYEAQRVANLGLVRR